MRNLIRVGVALILFFAGYWSWALFGAAQLAAVASQGDPQALTQRIDLPALRRSLADQIAQAFLDENPQFKKLASVEQSFVGSVSAGAINEVLRGMLTPENIAALLAEGRLASPLPGDESAGAAWRVPTLGQAFRGGPLAALRNSHFDGPLSFVVRVESTEGRYAVHLRLSGITWRLSALEIPKTVTAPLARAFAERVSKMIAAH